MKESLKKIYLITFHRAQSYGAFLQAFALQNCNELKKFNPIYIDYYPKRFRYRSYALEVSGSNIFQKALKFPASFICKTRMHFCIYYYIKKYLKITNKTYYEPSELYKLGNLADIYISGSDQIWDCRYDNLEHVLPYYLSFAKKEKYSYSSSCGEMQYYTNKDDEKYMRIMEELKTYTRITVREKESADDLNLCYPYKAEMMLDPTFLLKNEEWNYYLKAGKKKYKYILVYGLYRNPELKEYAVKLANEKRIKIINICDMFDVIPQAKNIFNVSPFRLLELIRDAEDVITDSFHGCALSINFKKELHIFMPLTSKVRILNLIRVFNLENRVVKNNILLDSKTNYSKVEEILTKERLRSSKYLKNIVGNNINN